MGLAHGTIGWADVAVPDTVAGAEFYSDLFGWEAQAGESDEFPYSMFTKDGKVVAGMGHLSAEQIDAGQPPVWSSYVIVDDADAVFSRAVELGATPIMEPMDVMDAGRMFFIIDPVGAAIGFWQSGKHDGAELFNEPGTMSWNEIASRDVEGAVSFYTELLGWTAEKREFDGFPYTILKVGDRMNGGAYEMSGSLPDEIPAHWLTWFTVEDCANSTEKIVALGGSVQRAPERSSIGVSAVVSDPSGATFGIIQAAQVDHQPPR
ncbi:MAG: VOC family protein [Acidimicrobiia bacterium]|nr:MAG: VOC family protein [Acidimicrobiia bacterium]